jgi:hypothetical protein
MLLEYPKTHQTRLVIAVRADISDVSGFAVRALSLHDCKLGFPLIDVRRPASAMQLFFSHFPHRWVGGWAGPMQTSSLPEI